MLVLNTRPDGMLVFNTQPDGMLVFYTRRLAVNSFATQSVCPGYRTGAPHVIKQPGGSFAYIHCYRSPKTKHTHIPAPSLLPTPSPTLFRRSMTSMTSMASMAIAVVGSPEGRKRGAATMTGRGS
eukprot:scaffold87760_cov26-Tisochrysis_lutea.AAC.1